MRSIPAAFPAKIHPPLILSFIPSSLIMASQELVSTNSMIDAWMDHASVEIPDGSWSPDTISFRDHGPNCGGRTALRRQLRRMTRRAASERSNSSRRPLGDSLARRDSQSAPATRKKEVALGTSKINYMVEVHHQGLRQDPDMFEWAMFAGATVSCDTHADERRLVIIYW
jgi:hypothetical protein